MSDSSSASSCNSENFLDIITEKVFAKDQKPNCSSVSQSCSSIYESDGKFAFCVCPVCCERQRMAINKDTVFQAEFQFHNLETKESEFPNELIKECRKSNVCGYIVFSYDRDNASGVMEGAIKNINKIKDWLETQSQYIPEPMSENIYFSLFLIARQPMKLEFNEHSMPPQPKERSSDGESSD